MTMAKNSILENSMFLSVNRKWPALSKTISRDRLKVGTADPAWTHGQKDLFKDCVPLKKLFNHDAKIDEFLDRRCMPFPLKKGIYLLPKDFFNEVENELTQHVANMQPLITAMGDAYEAEIDKAKQALGDEFNLSNYMPKQIFVASFQFDWDYLEFTVAGALGDLNKDVAARQQQKMNEKYSEAGDAIKVILRSSMQELVSHMIQKLTPGEDGKRKSFHSSIMNNLNEFFSTFETKNTLVNDEALQTLVNQAKQLTNGIAPDELKTSEELRANIVKGFEEIKTTLDALIVDTPIRSFKFAE